jgi:hypothetical protein
MSEPAPSPTPTPSPAPAPAPAAPAPSPSPAPAPTIASGDPAPAPSPSPSPAPEPGKDWRAQIAGDDKEVLKTLERFSDPKALFNAYGALRQKLSSGELKSQLPKDATPEQVAEWRKENGIPEAPDKYEIKLEDGHVLGEADKPLVASFQKFAHDANLPPAIFNGALKWYFDNQDAQAVATSDADAAFKKSNEDTLRAEWGKDYRPNINAIGNFFSDAPKGLFDTVLASRTPDGRLLGDHPDAVKFFAMVGRERFPTPTLIPGGAGDQGANVEGRINEIKGLMADRNSKYWKGAEANKLQEEYRGLIATRDRLKGKAA